MTITDAELAQRTALEQLAAGCFKVDRGGGSYSILDPADPEGTPLVTVDSLTAAELTEVSAAFASAAVLAQDLARRAFQQALDEVTPGTRTPSASPAMSAQIANVVAESGGDYTIALSGSGGATLATFESPGSALATALASLETHIVTIAAQLEIEADAVVNP